MKYVCTVIAVSDVNASRKFYENLLGLEVYQDYGTNIQFTCGLSLQQDFGWLVGVPEDDVQTRSQNMELAFETENFDGFIIKLLNDPVPVVHEDIVEHSWGQRVIRFYDPDWHLIEVGESMKIVIERFLAAGMTMDEISVKMDASVEGLTKLLNA